MSSAECSPPFKVMKIKLTLCPQLARTGFMKQESADFAIILRTAFNKPARDVLAPLIDGQSRAALIVDRTGQPQCFAVLADTATDRVARTHRMYKTPYCDIGYSNLKLHLVADSIGFFTERNGIMRVQSVSRDRTSFYVAGLCHLDSFSLPAPS